MASSNGTNDDPPTAIAVAGNDTDENDGGGGGEGESSSFPYTQGYTSGGAVQTLWSILSLMASPLTDETGSTKSVVAGLATILLAGTCVGLVAPSNEVLSPSYRKISAALGYIYFMAWSVSFYPQVIYNFKRKSTAGLSPDFVVLNVIGFACYTAYNVSFYWSPSIRELYKERFGPDSEITVQSNDVAFAIHALVLSLLTLCQIVYYNSIGNNNYGSSSNSNSNSNNTTLENRNDSNARLSKPIFVVILGITIVCIGYPLLVVLGKKFNWLDFLYLLSYVKIFISLIKYIPQVLLNVKRQSTMGWSIWNILLDLTGGTLSDLQLVLDCADLKDFSGITHNKAKLALGSLSIVFDLIFLVQHYCLYSDTTRTTATDEQSEPLLPSGNTEEGATIEGDDPSLSEDSSGPQTIFV